MGAAIQDEFLKQDGYSRTDWMRERKKRMKGEAQDSIVVLLDKVYGKVISMNQGCRNVAIQAECSTTGWIMTG